MEENITMTQDEVIENALNPVQAQPMVEAKPNVTGYVAAGITGLVIGFIVGIVADREYEKRKRARAAQFEGDEAVFEQMAAEK